MAEKVTQGPAIPEPTTDVAALLRTVQALKENVEILTGMRSKNVKGLGEQLLDLRSVTAGANARFVSYVEVSTSRDEALVRRTDTIEAEYKDADSKTAARITDVDTARADGDSALASRITTVEADYKAADVTTNARVTDEIKARTDANGAISQRITTFEATYNTAVDTINANITAETTARVNQDGAIATQINTLTASYNGATASGQIAMRAAAGINGVSASYHVVLTATAAGAGGVERSTGLYMTAGPGTATSVVFKAGQFKMIDNANTQAPMTVFDYSGGYFTLNGNVTINGGLIVNGTVDTNGLALKSATQGDGFTASSGTAAVYCNIKSMDSTVVVIGMYDGRSTRSPFNTLTPGALELKIDGVQLGEVSVAYEVSGNNDNLSVAILPTPIMRTFTLRQIGQGEGTHTFSCGLRIGTDVGPKSVFVMELIR